MITVAEARQIIKDHCSPLAPVVLNVTEVLHTVLSENIFSPIDMPSFDQSAVDGYAIRFEDYSSVNPMIVSGEMQAGSTSNLAYEKNTAVRIFTGAVVPAGYDTVIMQENVARKKHELIIETSSLNKGSNVRPQGSEITKGSLALEEGTLITAGAAGYLASLGITNIPVYAKPSISIIVTGKELQQPGKPLTGGQVYESNSITLQFALQDLHFNINSIQRVDDDMEELVTCIKVALERSDLLLVTGGVSVGDYDLVATALERCGVNKIFHRIKQKPGKPLYFGKSDNCIVFGLPGNPSSVLTCFYEYVLIALQQMINRKQPFMQELFLPITTKYNKAAGLTHFLKGNYFDGKVRQLSAQESYRLSSFALANCLITIPEATTEVKEGEILEVHILPQ